MLEQVVQYHLGSCITLQVDDITKVRAWWFYSIGMAYPVVGPTIFKNTLKMFQFRRM